jgi:hypothetical protein
MLMARSALVTPADISSCGKIACAIAPDPLKVNGNILALGLGKGY